MDMLCKLNSESFFGLFGDNSPLFDFYFFYILAESALNGLDDVGLVGLEGKEVLALPDFELGVFGVLLDEHS